LQFIAEPVDAIGSIALSCNGEDSFLNVLDRRDLFDRLRQSAYPQICVGMPVWQAFFRGPRRRLTTVVGTIRRSLEGVGAIGVKSLRNDCAGLLLGESRQQAAA
jgi:hypothetical protein